MDCYVKFATVSFTRVPLRNFKEFFSINSIENECTDWKFEMLLIRIR